MSRVAAALLFLLFAVHPGPAAEQPARMAPAGRDLLLVDDRGEPLRMAVEVCVLQGLERTCRAWAGSGEPLRLAGFDSVSVEGPEHGPASFRPQDLPAGREGASRLVVPRKAFLEIRGLPAKAPATLSLYKKDDRDFRRPALRVASPPREMRIPAGESVLSLASPGRAPDLHLVSAPPGGRVVVGYRPRPGWSLLLRVGDESAGGPVEGALVEVAAAAGYGDAKAPAATAKTERSGLAVLSGLAPQIATAIVRRPGYVDRQMPGLSATPGSFAFREVRLERPGSLAATILLGGRPAAGALCRLQVPTPGNAVGRRRETPRVLFDGTADREGVCRTTGIPQGEYLLRVVPAGRTAAAAARLETVRVEPGRETAAEVDLRPLPIEGTVRLGTDPAAGYQVRIRSEGSGGGLEEVGEAESGEDGEYSATLWSEGQYFLALFDSTGGLADLKRVWVGEGGATCDFELAAGRLEGIVTDREGRPVGGASVFVGLRREPSPGQAATDGGGTFRGWNVQVDEKGRFSFPLEKVAGRLTITARKTGFRPSEPVEVAVDGEAAPPPVALVLAPSDDIAGVLVSAAGAPLAGAWLAAFEFAGEAALHLGTAETGADGGFILPRARGAVTRVFLGGPGCPLRAMALARDDLASSRPLTLACGPVPASLDLTLLDAGGRPLPLAGIALRRGAEVLPAEVVAVHLARFGLPAATDGSGRLVVPGLEPGEYDLYLAGASNPATIAAGHPAGHLAAASLPPLAAAELEVMVEP